MPLTTKGASILKSMEETYGSKAKAEQVLYASKNAGKITGIDASRSEVDCRMDGDTYLSKIDAARARVDATIKRMLRADTEAAERRIDARNDAEN
jgi:hypothetical protein